MVPTSPRLNELGQPIGDPLPNWQPPPVPDRSPITGQWCRLEPLDADRHASALFEANALDTEGRNWTYLFGGPYKDLAEYTDWMRASCAGDDPLFFAFCDANTGAPVGLGSYLRITPSAGSIEVGHLCFSPKMQRTPLATDAMYLMMRNAFDLGYRRYEWKCDSLNAPSRAAAARFGFQYEGLFRQAAVYKGRNRDTAWFSILDSEWPQLRAGFEAWLSPTNFDADGEQQRSLAECRESP